MNSREKVNLWLKMGETVGVPEHQIQAVRSARLGLSDRTYRVTWTEAVDVQSPEAAAQKALVRLYADLHLRPDLFTLSVQDKDGVVTQVDLSGPKFLAGLQAGLKRCYPDATDSGEEVPVESEEYLEIRS